jgi:hypothetical protein
MTQHCIIDFETMGTNVSDCAVIDCSVFVFDWDRFLSDTPYGLDSISEVKKYKLSVVDQVKNYNYKVYKDTVAFWEEQPKEVRSLIVPKETDLALKDFVSELNRYLSSVSKLHYWWSRSNSFDPLILWRLFESQNKLPVILGYLPHYKLRDTRTFIDAKLNFPKENGFVPITDTDLWNRKFRKHDSSWDVLADVLRMQQLCRAENDLELL